MGTYSRSELLNEVSQIFRAGLNPGRDGGTLNTAIEYQQLLEMAATTFLFQPDSVFYIARLAANRLRSVIRQEAAVLEDLLVSLEDLGQLGSPVRDSTTLSNARTAILSLDAAESVTNRPETSRFVRQMDTFASQVKKNISSVERGNILVRPREDARNIIQKDLEKLASLHKRLLAQTYALRDVLEEYLGLDIPSRVSTNVLASINTRLQAAISQVQATTDTQNLEANRDLFLQTLANKVSVKLLSTFTDPTGLKFRSPVRPIPSSISHLGRVIGEGESASVTTSPGPWSLPISAPLQLRTQTGTLLTLNLDEIEGAALNGRNSVFYPSAGERNLHVIVDPSSYEGTVTSSDISEVTINEFLPLSFKHLGCVVTFPNQTPVILSDVYARMIVDLRLLQSFAPANISIAGPIVTAVSPIAGDEGAIGFQPGHVGAYLRRTASPYIRLEILEVLSPTQCVVDTRGEALDPIVDIQLRGSLSAGVGDSRIRVQDVFTNPPSAGDPLIIGPATKTSQLTVGGPFTTADIIADILGEAGEFDTFQFGATLNWHVVADYVKGDSDRLALKARTRLNSYLQITGSFLRAHDPTAPQEIVSSSAHNVLGYRLGEVDTTNKLTPSELVGALAELAGITAEVVTTELAQGSSMKALYNTTTVEDPTASFVTDGVQAGDQITLTHPVVGGTYQILSVSQTQLVLEAPGALTAEYPGIAYRVFRDQVKISLQSAGADSYLEVVSAPSELGLTVGKVYSSMSRFEAVDKMGRALTFNGVVAGDLLKLSGSPIERTITDLEDDNTTLVVEEGIPSNVSSAGFEIRSLAAKLYQSMNTRLETFTGSRNLLMKNNFHIGVEAIDNAMTAAILPGRNFVAARNQARRMVADLLSILTTELLRDEEYTARVSEAADNLASILDSYSPISKVAAVDGVLNSFLERKYDRSSDLLVYGNLIDFFKTTDETGSYAGAVLNASRKVVKDLPRTSRTLDDLQNQRDIAVAQNSVFDAEEDFSDSEEEPETPFE